MSKLTLFRQNLNLTQEELAEKSGISVRTIQRIEAGITPKGYTLRTLAHTLGIEESELLDKASNVYEVDITLLKLINLSSLPFTFIPPVNILLPLIIMAVKKQFNPLAKQIVSVQIIWTIFSAIIFMLSAIMKNWFSLDRRFVLLVMIVLILTNVFIILKNTIAIDKNKMLRIKLKFSFI
jgi:transcriptional regulator with XRE-family HTH domain